MNVLVVGGAGKVGSLVCPLLAERHALRIFDRAARNLPPGASFFAGDVCDPDALLFACEGMDVLLYMAMGQSDWSAPTISTTSFDVNVKGVYLALEAAHQAGIQHAVYTSSMSVYEGDLNRRYFPDEEITPDSRHIYGFTKHMGEMVCRNAARNWNMSVNALRLCLPQSEEQWLRETRTGVPTIATTAADVGRALLAALDYRGPGFAAFMISGDYEQRRMNMSRAKRVLGWEPLARPADAVDTH